MKGPVIIWWALHLLSIGSGGTPSRAQQFYSRDILEMKSADSQWQGEQGECFPSVLSLNQADID